MSCAPSQWCSGVEVSSVSPAKTDLHTHTHSHTRIHSCIFFSIALHPSRIFCCSCFSLFDTLFPFFDALFTVGFFIFWYFFSISLFFYFIFYPPPLSLSILALCILWYFQGGEGKEFWGIKHILPNFFEGRWAAVLNKVNLGLVKYTIYICKYICKQSGVGYKWKEHNFRLSLIFDFLLLFSSA